MPVHANSLSNDTVLRAYRRWAPVYDHTFGRVAAAGRRHAVRHINGLRGRVLEVGVGTGLSLPRYAPGLDIVGIDLSPDMLARAAQRVRASKAANVIGLSQMDAGQLAFADGAFDVVVAMYVMTVVPDPARVMRELDRVCAPGGEVILVNHFSQEHGLRGWIERKMAPFAQTLGWHPVFEVDRVMVCEDLLLVEQRPLWPAGLFSMLRFVRQPAGSSREALP
jgi:phosphatidylethanolamine/phosphatidyl-N-methylethanolamine N-methyltransferase